MKDRSLLILNGPGLSDLSAVGDITLEQVHDECSAVCDELGMSLEFRQTDDQNEMFRWITADSIQFDALLINPAGDPKAGTLDFDGYRAAFENIAHLNKPIIEVHLANVFAQDDRSTRPLQGPEGEMGFICGLGKHGYLLGIRAAARQLRS